MYICLYIHTHIYICTCIYIYIYTHIVYIYIYRERDVYRYLSRKEELAGVSKGKIVAAHGNFSSAHTLTGKQVHIHTCIHTYIHTYMYVYIYMYIRIHKHTYVYIYIHTYVHMYIGTCVCIYSIRQYVHMHMYVYVYVCVYIYIYIYTRCSDPKNMFGYHVVSQNPVKVKEEELYTNLETYAKVCVKNFSRSQRWF